MLDDTRAGNSPFLGYVPDQKYCNFASLGELDDAADTFTKLGDRTRRRGQIGPPAALVLELLEEEAALLRRTSAASTKQLAELKTRSASLTLKDEEQRLEIDQLRRENARLKAGARWPEWITGAAIVGVGMIVGAILQRSSGRRSSSRIRL